MLFYFILLLGDYTVMQSLTITWDLENKDTAAMLVLITANEILLLEYHTILLLYERKLLDHQNSTTFPWPSMTIFTKIHDLKKLETTKRAEQGLRQTEGVAGTQSLNWSAQPSYDTLSLQVS